MTPRGHHADGTDKGNNVISKLNEQELIGISDATNGIYIHLENLEDSNNNTKPATGWN